MTGYTLHTRLLQGSTHKKAGNKPCQDRILVRQKGDTLLLAVADGHGGSPYCRSGFGARLACQAAAAVLLNSEGEDDRQTAAALKDKYDRLVDKHLAFRPLSKEEKFLLCGRPQRSAYGATLLAAVIRREGAVVYQIGDGGVYLLNEQGRFLPPLQADADCTGCITSSMAYTKDRYLEHLRIRHYPRPAAALLFSDGYGFSSPLPWQAACLLRQTGGLESALDQLLQEGDHGDDQSFILWQDAGAAAFPAFLTGLDAEEQKGRLAQRLDSLREDYRLRYCWLELALQKGRRMEKQPARAEEFVQFKALLRQRLAEFDDLQKEMESLKKQLESPA